MRNAISVSRKEDFSKWYQTVIVEADLADRSSVRGCMVMKPWGYAIWENMQGILDKKFKELGVSNCYFPLFIPVDMFAKEADHVSGFAKEMAIVTHSKLESVDGKLTTSGKLEVPLAVRPTSEMIIGESFAKWIKSYRDLPIKINQWCNVVRWEMRTRLFLRTMEFLWQEGHTAHETADEAINDAIAMSNVYSWFIKDILKIHSIRGIKPDHERFPGAVTTYTIEAMMQDGKALQSATSHYLGQHFAKASGIQFQGRHENSLEHAHTASWGISTRIIGGLIMAHGDDDGINTPTSIAPYHIVIIPIIKDESLKESILEYCGCIKSRLDNNYRVLFDSKESDSSANKRWNYIRKGTPIICEIGAKEVSDQSVCFTRRQPNILKSFCSANEFVGVVADSILKEHDEILYNKSVEINKSMTIDNISDLSGVKEFFKQNSGFVYAKWDGNMKDLSVLDEVGVTVRCRPIDHDHQNDNLYIFAKAY